MKQSPIPGRFTPADGDTTPSTCMYTYKHSSQIDPTGTFTTQLSTTWAITATTNTQPGTTNLGTYTTTTTQPATIKEIQAIITG